MSLDHNEPPPSSTDNTTPWGYKVTVSIYVPGDIAGAAAVSDFYVDPNNSPPGELDFVGISISEVATKPNDHRAT